MISLGSKYYHEIPRFLEVNIEMKTFDLQLMFLNIMMRNFLQGINRFKLAAKIFGGKSLAGF